MEETKTNVVENTTQENAVSSEDNVVKTFDDLLRENKDYQSEFDKKIAKAFTTG